MSDAADEIEKLRAELRDRDRLLRDFKAENARLRKHFTAKIEQLRKRLAHIHRLSEDAE